MSDQKPRGQQLQGILDVPTELAQISLNLNKSDQFITGKGVDFVHCKAFPSPIGKKDKGGYRDNDALDTFSNNGMIYKEAGTFTAIMFNNSKSNKDVDGGIFDDSIARISLPRYYNSKDGLSNGEEILLSPGDRLFIKDLEVKVATSQLAEFKPGLVDRMQFPVLKVEFLMDSNGIEYSQGIDFTLTCDGFIKWINPTKNPGIDPDTGKGRVYSARYIYNAHWYVASLLHEVRVTRVTENGVNKPARMPYSAMIQREYVYFNQQNGDNAEAKNKISNKKRLNEKPIESANPDSDRIKINMDEIE
jgi:hypothetical protein